MKDLDRIITKYNQDINGNPISNHVIRRHTVSDNNFQALLDFIPSDSLGVRILEPQNIYEVQDPCELVEGTFYVDTINGKMYFHETMSRSTVLVDYYSIGLELIGVDRVYTAIDSKGNVLQTLGDILDGGKTVIDALLTMEDVLVVIEELKANTKLGNDTYERLGSIIDIATKLLQDLTAKNNETKQTITNAETKRQEVITTIGNAETKKQELITATNNANTKKREVETVITNANNKKVELENTTNTANTKKTELQNTINDSVTKKGQLQTVIDDSVVKKNELQAVINNADIPTMKMEITKNKNDIGAINIRTDGLGVEDGNLKLGTKTISNNKNNILWSGSGWVFTSGHSITLNKNISDMPNGVLLKWSPRNTSGAIHDWNWCITPIFKCQINGGGHKLPAIGYDDVPTHKFVYITENTITGHDSNNGATNGGLVLREVIEW
ncbi:MAG: hypothetical protein RSC24_06600 [Clostridium sp.]